MNATATNSSESVTVSGWSLAYTLYNGLNLVLNVDCDPANDNTTGTGSTGLYGLTGVVNSGVATLYVTNYVNDDLLQTYLYGITDTLATTTVANGGTAFTLLDSAPTGSVFRGVSFVPSIPGGSVEINSVPSGATITTSGTGCDPGTITTPLLEAWTPSSSCTLSVTSPQTVGGVQYTFTQWQDTTTGLSDVSHGAVNHRHLHSNVFDTISTHDCSNYRWHGQCRRLLQPRCERHDHRDALWRLLLREFHRCGTAWLCTSVALDRQSVYATDELT